MKLIHVEFYQAVRLPIKTKSNYNSVNEEIIPGVCLDVVDHLVEVSHPDWDRSVIVPTANVRFMEKEQPKKIVEVSNIKTEAELKAKKVVKSKK